MAVLTMLCVGRGRIGLLLSGVRCIQQRQMWSG